jgi:phosphate transport system substrate-binding protein
MRTLLPIAIILLGACQGKAPDPKRDDVPTKGDIVIVADKDLERIMDSERYVFESIYADAKVRVQYLPETQLREAMKNDAVRVVFTTCLPGADEVAFFRSRNLYPDDVPILTDAIAVVKGPNAKADSLSMDDLRKAMTGATHTPVFFHDARGGVVRTVVDSLLAGQVDALKNVSAVENLDSLLERLTRYSEAIGLISFARISDLDDPACKALRERMTLCRLSRDGKAYVLPNQNTIAGKDYPLCRKLYAVLKEGKTGLGTGFVSFVAGHKGQRIILKSGLAPQTIPGRDVELVTN